MSAPPPAASKRLRISWPVIGFVLLAAILIAVPLTVGNLYGLRLFMLFMIYGVIALGLDVLVGLTGLVSLGQAGLFALGAYTAAVLATKAGLNIVPGALAAIVITGAFGALLAYPTVRVRGVYLAVVTIAIGLIVENVAIEWASLTGGTTGISSIPKPAAFGVPIGGYGYYAVLAVLLFLTAVLTFNLRRSRFGRSMLAVSQSETAARSLGINPTAVRTLAFVVASTTAGLAGACYAFLNSYISPDIFTFSDSIRFLLMVILGGPATTAGPIVGAYILTYLPEYLQNLAAWQKFAYGALLALVMFLLPRGIIGSALAALMHFRPPSRALAADEVVGREGAAVALATGGGAELSTNGLTVRFGGLTALDDASIKVTPGQIHALIGPNGAGKSTFVNTISGFYKPSSGAFALDGADVSHLPPHALACRGLARTFQNTELFGNMTVLDNIMVGYTRRYGYTLADAMLRTRRFYREEAKGRAVSTELLCFVGLAEYAHEKACNLPFGLQRRLEIARALASAPKLLLLDEPAAGLTQQEIDALDELIRSIAKRGVSLLLIEHHVEFIMLIADTVTVLDYGKVIASDVPAAVQDDPRVIEAYFGAAPVIAASKERPQRAVS